MLDSSLLFWLKSTLRGVAIRVLYGEKDENVKNIAGNWRGKRDFLGENSG